LNDNTSKKKGRPKKQIEAKDLAAVFANLNPTQVQAEIYKRNFYEFAKAAFKVLEPRNEFIEVPAVKEICNILQKEAFRVEKKITKDEAGTKDIIINIPPRQMKTLIIMVLFPAWVWSFFPEALFICASYAQGLSDESATKARTVIQSNWYKKHFPNVELADDVNNKRIYKTTLGGARVSTSVGGTITGLGSHFLLIDDPIKPDEASSEVAINNCNNWYENTAENRVDDEYVSVRIIIMQRLAELDLSGFLLEKKPEEFTHICLPAELTENVTPAYFKELYTDGLLSPRRLGKDILAKKSRNPYYYAGQYLQLPAPTDGGIFNRNSFNIIKPEDFYDRFSGRTITPHFILDSAYTDKKTNDASALMKCVVIDNQLYILDVKTKHMLFNDLMNFIINYLRGNAVRGSFLYVEGKANGKDIIDTVRTKTGYNVKELQPGRDSKETRANSIADFVASKRVTLVDGAYVSEFLNQVAIFPKGKDDIVDCLVYAIRDLIKGNKKIHLSYT